MIIIIIIFTYCCSRFPTLPRRPLQNQKSTMRMCKQELWRRAVQRRRSYRWAHFAFSWRPPLTRWTLLSSRSRLALREQQHRRHHPAPQTVWQEKKVNKRACELCFHCQWQQHTLFREVVLPLALGVLGFPAVLVLPGREHMMSIIFCHLNT